MNRYGSQESTGVGNTFSDMDSFLDLDMFPSYSGPSSASSSSTNLARTASSNQPTIQPSFPYDLYPQTVLPPVSSDYIPELTSGASSSITMSPDLLDMDAQLNAMMPPFFFPETEEGTVDPASILGASTVSPAMDVDFKQTFVPQPPPAFDGKRLYAGIHTQRAAYNKDIENQRKLMAQQNRKASSASSPESQEQNLDDRINKILSSMKPTYIPQTSASPGGTLPHIARMKKDEEEMDEDERLLASEEGKKLSSKERRQLRNKVSARAFRSRRKEYISQLEAEVASKTTEATELRNENNTLKSEIAQLKEFTRSVLRSPAFSSFLADLEKGQGAVQNLAPPSAPTPEPTPSFRKDPNPNNLNLVNDDWALAYGPVAGAPMWATTPQVYAVVDVPKGPVQIQDLSGKAVKPSVSDYVDWANFPAPVDGFSPNRECTAAKSQQLSTISEESEEEYDVEMYDSVYETGTTTIDYTPPENLADLYEAKPPASGRISDRIEAIAPGVGLDTLLGRLEAVITGEADASEFFDVPAPAVQEGVCAEKMEEVEEGVDEETYRDRCRDVARMFDVVESYKRVGAVVGV